MVYASRFRRIWQQWEKERPQDEGDFEAV